MPKKEGNKVVQHCVCGHKSETVHATMTETSKHKHQEIQAVEEKENLPLTDNDCSKCGHTRAFYWERQMRAGDEPATRFYRCEKCKHTWRENK